MERVVRR